MLTRKHTYIKYPFVDFSITSIPYLHSVQGISPSILYTRNCKNMTLRIPKTATRSSSIASSLAEFLNTHPDLHLGGEDEFYRERRHHLETLGFHALPEDIKAQIGKIEFEGVRGPHGTIPIRIFYPQEILEDRKTRTGKKAAALVYMHGGGYTVGSVDEFENGLRLIAEAAGVIVCQFQIRLIDQKEGGIYPQLSEWLN